MATKRFSHNVETHVLRTCSEASPISPGVAIARLGNDLCTHIYPHVSGEKDSVARDAGTGSESCIVIFLIVCLIVTVDTAPLGPNEPTPSRGGVFSRTCFQKSGLLCVQRICLDLIGFL